MIVKDDRPPVVLLMGPTAAGKTTLAMDWYGRFPISLVSVDSALVYRGMNIGTAKPTPEQLLCTPHELIDIKNPTDVYCASDFVDDALDCIRRAHQFGRVPVLVGGSMLYFKALLEGLHAMPPADPMIRAEIAALAHQEGWQHIHTLLAAVDPITAHRLKPSDAQRIQRAWEVYRITGIPLSDFHRQAMRSPLEGYRIIALALIPEDRSILHRRIAIRLQQMLDDGLLEEVTELKSLSGLSLDCPSMRAVGYRQVWEYLEGQSSYAEMVEKALAATRQLAKRQLTWLRNWPHPIERLVIEDPNMLKSAQFFIKGLL